MFRFLRAARAGLFALPLLGAPAAAASQVAANQPRVDYTLQVNLDEHSHALQGRGVLAVHNHSRAALSSLYVHLYLNAFAHGRTVFFRGPTHARSGKRPEQWGNITVTYFGRVGSPDNLWPTEVHSPDDPEDATDIRVDLPEHIAAGQSADFDVVWNAQLPSLVERTGFVADFQLVGQWFPKLAKLEPDGSWAHFTFHPHAEFYANFGDYDVTLDVAANQVVGASGVLERTGSEGGRKQLRYLARNVHDFAWTAWPGFETEEREIAGVRVHSLAPPGQHENVERSMAAVAAGLGNLGTLYGPYPYADLTVISPPSWASEAGGMEYPGLITSAGPWYAGWLSNAVEQVTLHELAHQWFYGLVATNEAAWPFLDEGLTTYAEAHAMRQWLGPGDALDFGAVQLGSHAVYRLWGNTTREAIAQPARDFDSFSAIAELVYSRTGTLFETLARCFPGRFERGLQRYARDNRFAHPTPEHLLQAVEAEAGPEARLALQRALFERAGIDFAVASAGSQRQGNDYRISVRLERHGELQLPVAIELSHGDDTVFMRQWDGVGSELLLEYDAPAPLRHVLVDPQLRVLLDSDLRNNALAVDARANPSWSWRFVHWLSVLLRGVFG